MTGIFKKLFEKSAAGIDKLTEKTGKTWEATKFLSEVAQGHVKEALHKNAIFNKVAQKLTTPEREIIREIKKSVWYIETSHAKPQPRFGSMEDIKTILPSIDVIKALIAEGADLNKLTDDTTALIECARQAGSMIAASDPRSSIGIYGYNFKPADWLELANHYFEIAKILVEAGADPRVTNSAHNGPRYYLEHAAGEDKKEEAKSFGVFLVKVAREKTEIENRLKKPAP